jgi:vacuolar-type H+-ATPase subunit E/Vma4
MREYMQKARAADPQKYRDQANARRQKNLDAKRAKERAYEASAKETRKAQPSRSAEARRDACRRWVNKNRHRLRGYHVKHRYGLTKEQLDAMVEAQSGKCAICLVTPPKGAYAVDHCHETGAVRGLLCRKCNTGIAMFSDRPELLSAAIRYLQQTKAERVA